MRVGLTFDLKQRYLDEGYSLQEVAELDSHETIDAIASTLQTLGYQIELIGNIKDLVIALAHGQKWDLVFNIAEGLHGLCRESQIPALLEAYRIPFVFSDALTLTITLHKGLAKALVREHHVPTADYRVVRNLSDLDYLDLPFPLFIKPVGGGTGMGIDGNSIVHNRTQLHSGIVNLLPTHKQPVLVERFLAGREFTVGVTGTGSNACAIGVMEILVDPKSDQGVYSYATKQNYLDCTTYRLVEGEVAQECAETALGAWRALDCRDGGRVDLRMDSNGIINFLEVNPLAGLHPVDSDLPILARLSGVSYKELLKRIMDSACQRVGLSQ